MGLGGGGDEIFYPFGLWRFRFYRILITADIDRLSLERESDRVGFPTANELRKNDNLGTSSPRQERKRNDERKTIKSWASISYILFEIKT